MRGLRKFQKLLELTIVSATFVNLFFPKPIKAQGPDVACIGPAVAEYMNTVIDIAGNLNNIRLLSPAFNMTSPVTPSLVAAMNPTANWAGLDGYAGNAYNIGRRNGQLVTVTTWVSEFYAMISNLGMPTRPAMITETGRIEGTLDELRSELINIRDGSAGGVSYLGATLFNSFSTNDGWDDYIIPGPVVANDADIEYVCGGSCGIIGINSAEPYEAQDISFYNRAQSRGMTRSLEISNADDATTQGVQRALERGITPIIRIGTVQSAGPDATAYANFLVSLDSQVSGTVYAIAGPNEPESEPWVAPKCGVGSATPPPNYVPCNEVRFFEESGEFHTYRPYQASPCDLSYSELALFCGSNFTFVDPYTITKTFANLPQTWNYDYLGAVITPVPPEDMFNNPACTSCVAGVCTSNPAPCDAGLNQCASDAECIQGCSNNLDGTETCTFEISQDRDIAIDLSGAEFPIMGNTEDVVNRVSQTDTFADPRKVNEYVSWYLNGVTNNPAEYGPINTRFNCVGNSGRPGVCKNVFPVTNACFDLGLPPVIFNYDGSRADGKSTCTIDIPYQECCVLPNTPQSSLDREKIINYPGVLRKLLSHRSQRDVISGSGEPGGMYEDGTIQKGYESRYNDAGIRHDQTVGCIDPTGAITPCYPQRIGVNPVRLSDFNNNLPPKEEDYPSAFAWVIAYKQWRGQTCITILGANLCFNNPLAPDYWGNLFFSIPFSSTEDRMGMVDVVSSMIQPAQPFVRVQDVVVTTDPADLFFAHVQETSELGDLLQRTYAPQEGDLTGLPLDDIYEPGGTCEITEVRTNPGDNLFAGEILANIQYDAQADCTFYTPYPIPGAPPGNVCQNVAGGGCQNSPESGWRCSAYYGQIDCPDGQFCGVDCVPAGACSTDGLCTSDGDCCPGYSCSREVPTVPGVTYCEESSITTTPILTQACPFNVNIVLGTATFTPKADELWSRFVAGPMGVFRRVFPKVEVDAPIEAIWDIPASTPVTYTAPGVVFVTNPGGRTTPELYFPHIGGIHQYFLKCIQRILRPEGFGEACLSGTPGTNERAPEGNCPSVPDSAVPARWLGSFRANFIDLANRWTARCPGSENNLADECYNYVVQQSIAAGVNPAFTLTIWLNETDASNYCFGGPTTQDFGINDASIYQNAVAQLQRFLLLPFSSTYLWCRGQCLEQGCPDPMFAFMTRFRAGGCNLTRDPSNPGFAYYNNVRNTTWQWVTGNCVDGLTYSIEWPTDNTCP